jgi:putative hydrolase of the HAD superfamily
VRAVLFDFAGTLFDDRALRDVHLRQLQFVARAAGIEANDQELRSAYRQGMEVAYRAEAVQAFYSLRTLFGAAFAATAVALGGTIDEATADEAVDRQYRATMEEAVLRPDCLQTLATLQRSSIHVQIVSNIDDEQFEPMLERFDLFRVIDAWTSSEQAASCKPDPGIYRLAVAKAGVLAEQALFVGDSIRHDVEGPAELGLRTAWLAPGDGADPGSARPDAVITALAEVLDLAGVGVVR